MRNEECEQLATAVEATDRLLCLLITLQSAVQSSLAQVIVFSALLQCMQNTSAYLVLASTVHATSDGCN